MAPRTPLLDPAGYFGRRDAFSLSRAGAVVALNWLAIAVFAVASVELLLANVVSPPPQLRAAFERVLPGTLFVLVFLLVIAWALTAVGLHVLARFVGGSGSFWPTLAIAAWGMAPDLVAMPVKFALLYARVDGARLSAESPRILREQTQMLFGSGDGPLAILVTIAVAAWSAYVWTFGTARAHGLDVETAAIPAVAVAVVGLLLDLL